MAYFTLNGIDFDVIPGERETSIIGARRRMFDGSYKQTVRTSKEVYATQTGLLSRDDADAFYSLLMGYGHNWKFAAASDYYSGKGLGSTATNGTPTAGGASGKFDKRLSLDNTEYVTWTPSGDDALAGDYTISVWWLDTTWKHVLKRYVASTTTTTYYRDGVTDASFADWTNTLTVTAGVLKLLGEVGGDAFSDLVALPFAVPTSWIPSMAAYTRAYPNRPNVEVYGDMFNADAVGNCLTCCPVVEGFTPVPQANALDGGRVSFRLEEV